VILSGTKPAAKRPHKLASLRVTPQFRVFALEQLSAVPELQDRSMFGGVGVYSGDLFFALIARDVLYFKVDATNRVEYRAAGSKPFKPYPGRTTAMGYYAVPVSVLEDAEMLATWAKRAIAVAKNSRATKPARRRVKRTS
jgi:DNA transformation protein and related proteins